MMPPTTKAIMREDVLKNPRIVRLRKHQVVFYQGEFHRHHIREDDVVPVEQCLDPVQVAIARLSDQELRRMQSRDVLDVLALSCAFTAREWNGTLQFMELNELISLAFVARRYCRQEVNAAYLRRGKETPFQDDL